MSEAVQAASLSPAQDAPGGVSDSLEFARVDNVIGDELAQIPGLDEIIQDAVSRAKEISEALAALTAAVDLDSAAESANAGKASGTPLDAAKVKAAVSQLGDAADLDTIVGKIERVLGDPDNQAKLRELAGGAGLSGGVEEARGGLKSITPYTVGISQKIRGVIASIKNHEAVAGSESAKAALEEADAELTEILDALGKDINRLVEVVDSAVGATFA
jgi:hypothetical protein